MSTYYTETELGDNALMIAEGKVEDGAVVVDDISILVWLENIDYDITKALPKYTIDIYREKAQKVLQANYDYDKSNGLL